MIKCFQYYMILIKNIKWKICNIFIEIIISLYTIMASFTLIGRMAYIYMDESWDLGFNDYELNSKYFLITFLVVDNEKEVNNVMKNLYKWMDGKKVRRKKSSFFHANQEWKTSVKRALDLASRRDIIIISLILKKDTLSSKDKEDIHTLYNRSVWYLLEQCEKRGYLSTKDKHYFIASRKETKKQLNEDFIAFISSSHSDLLNIDILINTPSNVKWLELVDPISYAIYQKYENWDLELYSIVKNKVMMEFQNFN